MANAVGAIGVGLAVSVGAFFVGSVLDDLIGLVFHFRGAKAFTAGSDDPYLSIIDMPDGVRAELERLEGTIDRANAEARLRLSMLAPLSVAVAAAAQDAWWWVAVGLAAGGGLLFQFARRRLELLESLVASHAIRHGWESRLQEQRQDERARQSAEAQQRELEGQQQRATLARLHRDDVPF